MPVISCVKSYNDGFIASQDVNKTYGDNPYKFGTQEYKDWFDGFNAGSEYMFRIEDILETGVRIVNPNEIIKRLIEDEKELLIDES